jgi:hypothetical protein
VNKAVSIFDNHGIVAMGKGVFISFLSIPSRISRFRFDLNGKNVHLECIEFANGSFAADFTHEGHSMLIMGQIEPDDEGDYDYD